MMLRSLYAKLHLVPEVTIEATPNTVDRSAQAIDTAEIALQQARDTKPRVKQIADRLRYEREENHLAQLIRASMRGTINES